MVLHRVKSHAYLRDKSKQCLLGDDEHHVKPAKSNYITSNPDTISRESNDPTHNHDTIPVQEEAISSSTKPVITTEEANTGGTTQSELHNVGSLFSEFDPGSLPSPISPPNLTGDDCDPSDSLLMQASLYIPDSDDNASVVPNQSDPAVEQSKPDCSSQSWHDWFVTLFAGRKATPATRKAQNKTTSSAGSLVPDPPTPQLTQSNSTPDSTQAAPNPQPRRLLHCDVIPPIQIPKLDRAFRRTTYKHIPPAPMTDFTGYAVVAQDEWEPEIVMRGFGVTKRTSTPSLAPNYINHAARLLDRDGDKFARYRMEHLMTRSRRAFSGDTGEQYPFSHGHCW